MATFTPHELYGGAITCQLPSDYIDSSTLRDVPSHQEVYLSPTTLTNIIIEINQHESSQASDIDAAIYHFKDVIDAADMLQSLTQPTVVSMQSPSLSNFPAYSMSGISTETVKSKPKPSSVLPPEWERTPTPQTVDVQIVMYQLLVRMKSLETDLCVRINVPLREFEEEEAAGKKEMGFAEECLRKMVESLDVRDFGLFEG